MPHGAQPWLTPRSTHSTLAFFPQNRAIVVFNLYLRLRADTTFSSAGRFVPSTTAGETMQVLGRRETACWSVMRLAGSGAPALDLRFLKRRAFRNCKRLSLG
jgi:hypothetical protein